MKNLIVLFVTISIAAGVSAQSQTAYLDLYQRGGGQHLRTTPIYNGTPVYIGKTNLGETLNRLSNLGWEVDHTLEVQRIAYFLTRHKFHIILKKEYHAGENPFEGLSLKVALDNRNPGLVAKPAESTPRPKKVMTMEEYEKYVRGSN